MKAKATRLSKSDDIRDRVQRLTLTAESDKERAALAAIARAVANGWGWSLMTPDETVTIGDSNGK